MPCFILSALSSSLLSICSRLSYPFAIVVCFGSLPMQHVSSSKRRIYLLQCPRSSQCRTVHESHRHAEEVIHKVLLDYASRELPNLETRSLRQYISVQDSQVLRQGGMEQSSIAAFTAAIDLVSGCSYHRFCFNSSSASGQGETSMT